MTHRDVGLALLTVAKQMPFLHYETHDRRLSMSETIRNARRDVPRPRNASRDELLVHAYIDQLHPRRTLDQFLYHGIDTTQRDNDQVVWRYCEKHHFEPKVFMVDQLWLWVLGGGELLLRNRIHVALLTMF